MTMAPLSVSTCSIIYCLGFVSLDQCLDTLLYTYFLWCVPVRLIFACSSTSHSSISAAISAETMTIHHTKHHNTYVTNLNATLEKLDGAMTSSDVSEIIALQGAMKFNGGGHLNHTLFWENMCPEKKAPSGALEKAITASFGDFESMKSEMSAKSVGRFTLSQ